jgi:hypothetical protein
VIESGSSSDEENDSQSLQAIVNSDDIADVKINLEGIFKYL